MADTDTKSGTSFWTKRWHGLPVWAWAGLGGAALGGVYYIIKHRSSTTSANTAAQQAAASQAAYDASNPYTLAGTSPAYGPPATTIMPSNTGNGISPSELLQILQDLGGTPSNPVTSGSSGGSNGGGTSTTPPSTVASSPPVQSSPTPSAPQISLSPTTWGQWSGDTQYGKAPGSTQAVYLSSPQAANAFFATYGSQATYYNTNWNWKTQGPPPSTVAV